MGAIMNIKSSLNQKYNPSDKIVSLVFESIKIPFHEMNVSDDVLNNSIKKTIPDSLTSMFAHIGKELSDGNKDSFPLTVNGEFIGSVIDAIVFRIPVEKKYKEQFSKYLYDEIVPCALTGALDTDFTKLSLIGDDLVLVRHQVNE
jgi:hypothetical protein